MRFGDVLVFDTTYKTNTYKKPLVMLVGCNNRWQTTVFACRLLVDETTETYLWVLETFLCVMNSRYLWVLETFPATIISG